MAKKATQVVREVAPIALAARLYVTSTYVAIAHTSCQYLQHVEIAQASPRTEAIGDVVVLVHTLSPAVHKLPSHFSVTQRGYFNWLLACIESGLRRSLEKGY